MDTIVRITNILKSGERTARQKYYIPEAWNYFGYTDYERNPARPKEILVCPFHFSLLFGTADPGANGNYRFSNRHYGKRGT